MNLFIRNIGQLVTVAANGERVKRGAQMRELHIHTDASLVIRDGIIVSIGKAEDAPPEEMEVLDAAGRVTRFFPRDPSWLTWPALELLVQENIVPDFPVCNKSVNGSYSGNDL